MGDIERQTIIHNDFRAEHREIMGYDEHEEPELKDLDLVTDIRAELQLPALLGAIGVLLSTVASVMSLYVE